MRRTPSGGRGTGHGHVEEVEGQFPDELVKIDDTQLQPPTYY